MTDQTKILFRVIDTETAGMDGPEVHDLIELGWTDVVFDTATRLATISDPKAELFDAPRGIPTDAQAVHHIVPADVAGLAAFNAAHGRAILMSEAMGLKPMFIVAHNAEFDRRWLTEEMTAGALWICTFKAAARLIPQAKSHGNQALRYMLNLPVDRVKADPPHRAAADSYVTAHLLQHLIGLADSIAQLELFTRMPRFYAKCPMGKHKGAAWADVPASYLDWMLKQGEMERDLRCAAQDEIDHRRQASMEAMERKNNPQPPAPPAQENP